MISAIVLAKNEEERIEKCLESISWCDEIILIDNGSVDNTVTIAKKYNCIIVYNNSQNFSELRNSGKKIAQNKWLLYLDADEVVTNELKSEILSLIDNFEIDTSKHTYFIKRKTYYLNYLWPYLDRTERLFYSPSLIKWHGRLHESPEVIGRKGICRNYIIHDTHRTLEEMIIKTNDWSSIEAKLRFESSHPQIVFWRLLRVMLTGFYDSFFRKGGWKAGTVGWIESIFQAFSMFVTYAKLWELQNQRK